MILHLAVILLVSSRGNHVAVDDIDLGLGILLADIFGLLQAGHAADRRAVGQVFLLARAGALHKQHAFRRLAIRWSRDLPARRHLLQLDVGDHVRQSVAERRELGRVVRLPAGRHDDRADALDRSFRRAFHGHVEHAGLTFGFQNPGRAEHFDARVGKHRVQLARQPVGGCFRVRSARWKGLFQALQKAAELRLLFDQHHVIAGGGRIQRRAQAGDAASDNQHGPRDRLFRQRLQRLHLCGLHQAHADRVFGQRLRILVLGFVTPGDLFAQVDAIERHPRIE